MPRAHDRMEGGSSWPSGVAKKLAQKANRIDETYDAKKNDAQNLLPDDWETAAQAVSKFRAIAENPAKTRL